MVKKTILITGGAGYVGAKLVPRLLDLGYRVIVYDLFIYGNIFNDIKSDNLIEINGDIRNIQLLNSHIATADIIIHLACISNDPSAELDYELTKSINYDAFEPIITSAIKNKIKRFIYASSSSVYGISDSPNVDESHIRVPVSEYNKSKAYCEDVLKKYSTDIEHVIVRPATICGTSKRQRLDLTVNILNNHAYHKNKITVFGGEQFRPNLHIDDMIDLYIQLINEDKTKINNQIFNAGYENQKIIDIANDIKEVYESKFNRRIQIVKTESDDMRSYRISTKKIESVLNFKPKKTVKDASIELYKLFDDNLLGNTFEDINYYNVKKMKGISLN